MTESDLVARLRLEATKRGWRLFRNNVGVGWAGNPCTNCQQTLRRIRYGLGTGSSDLVGWRPFKVTADMVGRVLALFVAREAKTVAGKATPEQLNFIDTVNRSGGDAKIVRSVEQL